MRKLGVLVTCAVFVVLAFAPGGSAVSATWPKQAPVADAAIQTGESLYKNPPSPICTLTPPDGASDYAIDCEPGVGIHNETAIAVDPTDSNHWVASANDYQLKVSQGGSVNETVFSRAKVTFDAGATWTTYPIRFSGYLFTGDPSLAFDAVGNVYFATLADALSNSLDVVVSHSTDGGRTWSTVRVAAGKGSFSGRSILHDHPILTTWGNGNVLVTWIKYVFGNHAILSSAPMVDSVSHDGGLTWSAIHDISGSAPTCVGLTSVSACDQTWGNAVAASASGRVVATFYDTDQYRPDGSTNLARTKHYATVLNPSTGAIAAGPFLIGQAYDGINEGDYPVNVDGRQTLHDSEFRLLMQGNIAVDPTNGMHFAVVWYDDRNANLPVNPDPYKAATNNDVIVSQSFDGGATWTSPVAIQEPNDQFMPWAAYDARGRLRVGYFDRSYDPANHAFGYTVATEKVPGSLTFSTAEVTTALSDATQGSRWFVANVDPSFPNATRFVGDYSAVAAMGRHVVAYWTDLRDPICANGVCGAGQTTFVARTP